MPHRHHIPPPAHCQVWLDFDGTITRKDVLDELIQRYAADDSWKEIERQWQLGQIGSYECLKAEFACVRIGKSTLDEFLDTIPIDPGLHELIDLLHENHVPTMIVSDGIDYFIRHVLKREKIAGIHVRSNTIQRHDDRMELICPHRSNHCQTKAAHCKCASIKQHGNEKRSSIYVGDGRSDLCPSSRRDITTTVFAKNALATSLRQINTEFIEFKTLSDVARVLGKAWGQER